MPSKLSPGDWTPGRMEKSEAVLSPLSFLIGHRSNEGKIAVKMAAVPLKKSACAI